MKKIILCVIILLISCVQSQTQTAENNISGIRENADYTEIKNVHFYISKKSKQVDGYVVFLDKDGKLCSTDGTITLSVKKKHIIGRTDSSPKPIVIVREDVTYSKQIVFKPDDFKFLTLSSGGILYALPVNLPLDKVSKGDIVMLEWYTFKTEQEIVESPDTF